MSRRREFTKAVKVEIVGRATFHGVVHCETCSIAARRWEIDHTTPDGLHVEKSKTLTAANGMLLCSGGRETCHGRKTAQDVAAIAKAKRNEARHLGIAGRLTALSGPSRDELDERRPRRSKSRQRKGKLPVPARFLPPGFVPAIWR